MKKRYFLILTLVAFCLWACGDGGNATDPKVEAAKAARAQAAAGGTPKKSVGEKMVDAESK